MPVQRFLTHEAARTALWSDARDPRLPARLRAWWKTCARINHTVSPRGVRRFATIEDANAERALWVVETLQPDARGAGEP